MFRIIYGCCETPGYWSIGATEKISFTRYTRTSFCERNRNPEPWTCSISVAVGWNWEASRRDQSVGDRLQSAFVKHKRVWLRAAARRQQGGKTKQRFRHEMP
jgi:hypothetical protein